jgi:AraC-like DNA-binding protein
MGTMLSRFLPPSCDSREGDDAPDLLSDEQASVASAPDEERAEILARVRASLGKALESGAAPTLEGISAMMRMSARTLQRRLQESGVRFSELLDNARSDAARKLLADDDATVNEIAYKVGYAQPRAFLRAFKRWTGETPRRYRRRQLIAAANKTS